MASKASARSALPTVRIHDPNREGHVLVINRRDYDPATHTLADVAAPAASATSTSTASTGAGSGSDESAPDGGTPATPPAPPAAGSEAPAFLQGITRPVLEAMKVADLVALAQKGGIDGQGRKKAELVAELAALAKLD